MRCHRSPFEASRPVVIGTGLTGLAISRALSSARIPHVLIGNRPSDAPRLGESLNAEGSLEAARQFPDLAACFLEKRRQALFFGTHALSFDFVRDAAGPVSDALLGYPSTIRFLHVDRFRFDRRLFDAVVADQHCTHRPGRAVALEYHAAADRIDAVHLADGSTIGSSYVFDATNHLCFVARNVGLRRETLGKRRRVVFAHYRGGATRASGRLPWMDATSLLRLAAGRDGVDGVAWCIPLGDYVSIGISVDAARTRMAPDALLDRVDAAWTARGVDVRAGFSCRGRYADLGYEHYRYERCYGRNWLLAGTSCCQFWFPTASGVATGLIAARFAPDALRAPVAVPPIYAAYLDRLAGSHTALDWLEDDDPWSATEDTLRDRAQAMVDGNAQRLAAYVGLLKTPSELASDDALLRAFEQRRKFANPLRIHTAPLAAQASRVFSSSCEPDPWMDPPFDVPALSRPEHLDGPQAILRLVDLLSGRRGASDDVVTPDVRLQIDRFTIVGIDAWAEWVRWIRESKRVKGLELVPGSLKPSDNDWKLTAQWRGRIHGVESASPTFDVTFGATNELVSRVRTSRADYTFVLGDSILPEVAFVASLAVKGVRPPSAAHG